MFAKRCVKKQQRVGIPLSEGAEKILHQTKSSISSSDPSGSSAPQHGEKEEEKTEEIPLLKTVTRRTRVPIKGKHFLIAKSEKEARSAEETLHAYRSDPKLNLHNDNRATAVFDVDPDRAHDHRAILERNEEISRKIEKGELESGIYRGQGAHRVYVHRSEGALSNAKSSGLYGPVRGINNIRMTMYVDYNPEICKDYKETGYCGFGNTCKFLHDRHDYKGGWQIEREWQQQQQKKQEKLARLAARRIGRSSSSGEEEERRSSSSGDDSSSSSSDDDDSDTEQLPFACLKCREKWREDMNPVVTRCRHYFCEKCAFSHYSTSIKCYVCGVETQGIFNAAHNLIAKVKQREEIVGRKKNEATTRDHTCCGSKRRREPESGNSSEDEGDSSRWREGETKESEAGNENSCSNSCSSAGKTRETHSGNADEKETNKDTEEEESSEDEDEK